MRLEPLTLAAAALLLAVSLLAWRDRRRGRVYLRFGATLMAALAIAALAKILVGGLDEAAARLVLPLGGAALGLAALRRVEAPLPQLFATLCLVAALAAGLEALLLGGDAAAFIVLALGGAVMALCGFHRRLRPRLLMAGLLLIAAASAFTVAGAGAPTLALLAAGLLGIAI